MQVCDFVLHKLFTVKGFASKIFFHYLPFEEGYFLTVCEGVLKDC